MKGQQGSGEQESMVNSDNAGSDPQAAEQNWLCCSLVIHKQERIGRNRGYVPLKQCPGQHLGLGTWLSSPLALSPMLVVFIGSLLSLFQDYIKQSGLERYFHGILPSSSTIFCLPLQLSARALRCQVLGRFCRHSLQLQDDVTPLN